MRYLYSCLITAGLLLSGQAMAEPTNRVFVTNERSNTVSVINGETLELEAEIKVGKRPRGIGLSPDRSELYIALGEEDAIEVIDPKTLKVTRRFDSGSDPETFAVHPNGNLYISNEDAGLASAFNPKTGEKVMEIQVGLEPEGVAISPDGKKVMVTSESSNMLHVISVPEHQIIANILVGARPRDATFTADSLTAYATSEISGEVKKIDMTTHEITEVVKLEDANAKPKDVRLTPDEKKLYVAGGRSNSVYVLDPVSMKVLKNIPVGKRVWGLAISSNGKRVFSTDGVDNQVSVIDTEKDEVIKVVKVGEAPWGVVIDD